MKQALRKEKLLETAEKVRKQIETRFPNSGLAGIADDVVQVTQQALVRAEAISRPNLWLRAGLVLLFLIAVAGVIVFVLTRQEQMPFGRAVVQFLDTAKADAAILTALAIFLITLETRLKRRRGLRAVHELRAIAHIVDMHQLTKSPDRLGDLIDQSNVAGQPMDANDMVRYLHYCTELLAVVSKIGQLYVQDFPDPDAQTAVDHFESLATGLSGKIWQKLMILDRIRSSETSSLTASPSEVEEDEISQR